jgi:hypothetical protein
MGWSASVPGEFEETRMGGTGFDPEDAPARSYQGVRVKMKNGRPLAPRLFMRLIEICFWGLVGSFAETQHAWLAVGFGAGALILAVIDFQP